MAFHEILFPDTISRGARGGPRRNTQVVELASGDEERNGSWANSRRVYDVSFGIRNANQLHSVVEFFEARNGRLYGFRFKDWSDYKSCAPLEITHPMDMWLADGDGSTVNFQLQKTYFSGDQLWRRQIRKPIADTVRVSVDGTELVDGWSVNLSNGIVTFDTAPASGAIVRAGFQFHVPVRFDTDQLDVTLDIERLGSIPSIPLIEVRR